MWQRQNNHSKQSDDIDANWLREKAAAYCAAAEHCPYEVQTKLMQWGADTQQTEDIINWLTDENFLSPQRYCQAFVNDKIRFQAWGKRKIQMTLAEKRLPQQVIQEALNNFPEEEYINQLQAIIEAKQRQLGDPNTPDNQAKLFRYLASKGFSYSDIAQFLNI